jgi:exopolysaccharide production protein ExoQ
MTVPTQGGAADMLYAFFSHARLARVMSVVVLTTVLLGEGIRPLIGWPGYLGVVATEVIIMALIVLARRRDIIFARALPISLAVFLVWSLASVGWSSYAPQTIAGVALQWVLTSLALGMAATRDSIQIIRAVGSALRVTLGISLGLELLSGIIVREPFSVWGIAGNIAVGGPIQGVTGSRNALATMAVIALITFAIELRTKSVTKRVGVFSIVGAAIVVLLTQAPLGWVASVVVGVMGLIIYLLRRVRESVRLGAQLGVVGVVVIGAVLAWVFRGPLIVLFSAQGTMAFRVELWQRVWQLAQAKPITGWGYVGEWPTRNAVFGYINTGLSQPHSSALNSYLDVLFQLGAVGLAILCAVLGIALVRSWIMAIGRKSSVFVWAPLVLTTLLVASLLESTLLGEWGWLIFVLVVARASRDLPWRRDPQMPEEGAVPKPP